MATVTVVITHDGTAGAGDCNATSYTWAGANYADMTVAQTKAARQLLTQALNITAGAGASASPTGTYQSHAASGRGT